MKKSSLLGVLCATLFMLISGAANAATVTVPVGLNPGDMYRLVFVTSSVRDPKSTNIADYNAFVTGVANTQADLVSLGTTWSAIGSTGNVDARDNTNTNPFTDGSGVPIYNLGGQLVVNNYVELWDGVLADAGISNPISFTESGSTALNRPVWTGTKWDGTEMLFQGCTVGLGRASCTSSGDVSLGSPFGTNFDWIWNGLGIKLDQLPLYAISDVLTVPSAVPIPPALWLFGSGLLGLVGVARRKKA
jgi:hypothetical protein